MNVLKDHVEIPSLGRTVGTGWLPPTPDLRDYSTEHPEVATLSAKLGIAPGLALPPKVDLRQWCSPVADQGSLGSCTANAAVGVVEFYQCRLTGKYTPGSRLFIYKITRNLMGVVGDTGAWLRNTMGALSLCGVPPEKYWPYTDMRIPTQGQERYFDSEPPAFVYAVADNFESLKYFCHDPIGQDKPVADVFRSVKAYLSKGIPSMFGFFGFPSFGASDIPGGIPYPGPEEQAAWGHAVVAVGYDDNIKITNIQNNQTTTGALLIRNSWSTFWGDNGYGWLPFDYVTNRLAVDFWSLLTMEVVDLVQFDL